MTRTPEPARIIPFTGNSLDRASHRRTDIEWIKARRSDPRSLIHPMWRLQAFATGGDKSPLEAAFFAPGLCEPLAAANAPCIFLGLDDDRAVFALDVSAAEDPENSGPLAGLGKFHELRGAAALLALKDVAILGQAKSLIDWHQRHGFCPRCGSRTELMDGGYRRLCQSCGAEHFPRTDPVVIMLATLGDSCLVGRGRNFPGFMYSALAGFIEPGETIEEAVRREIFEEAGIRTGIVRYVTAQPWPFPSSLMIGCFAEALDRAIRIDEAELADARWLDRDTVRALLEGEHFEGIRIPPPIAIAHHLLKTWADGA
ncbi:MAG TPA: NAD(+) diphosphatase [Bryobacteraceae bacterium]|nr:NAD(+) diphosphatase [Bryobacteraceae bacterium]